MARKLLSRIASSLIGKKAAKRVPVTSAPVMVEQPHVTSAPVQSEVAVLEPTPLTMQERQTNFNPVLLKVGNITNHLSTGATLTGDLVLNEGGLRLKCRVEGSVTQASDALLIIDQDAVVTGTVRARYLLVLGEVNGDLEADRIVVGASARVTGDITYRRSFGSVTGAKIRGRIAEVEHIAVVRDIPVPTPAPAYADFAPRKADLTPSPVLNTDDEDDVYAVADRRKVFPFPSMSRDEEMGLGTHEVRYAVR